MVTGMEEAHASLAFVYSGLDTEDPPLLLAEAADGVARLLWIVPDAQRLPRAVLRMLRGLGEVVDAGGLDMPALADLIGAHAPAGIVCCNDAHLLWAAEIAKRLGLRYVDTETASRLTDKLVQRRALRAAGLPSPDVWDVDDLTSQSTMDALIETASFPLVLKPRTGHASQGVEALADPDALRAAVAGAQPGRMMVESFIPDPSLADRERAPYVSVELMACRGVISVLGVTGRTPLAPPFRETGVVFPAELATHERDAMIAAAVAAAEAMGVEDGPLHVEVKSTDEGPVVIEVNGVMGGGAIRDLMQRTAGVDILRLTMRVAVGEDVVLDRPPRARGVGFFYEIQPDAAATRIVSVDGVDALAQIPGIERMIPGLRAGDECSWRTGTHAFIVAVLGVADDHETARLIRRRLLDTVRVTVER